jgi:hypothetical protein
MSRQWRCSTRTQPARPMPAAATPAVVQSKRLVSVHLLISLNQSGGRRSCTKQAGMDSTPNGRARMRSGQATHEGPMPNASSAAAIRPFGVHTCHKIHLDSPFMLASEPVHWRRRRFITIAAPLELSLAHVHVPWLQIHVHVSIELCKLIG